MPYDNLYNVSIAKQVDFNNRKYVAFADATGQGTVDYTQSTNLVGGKYCNSIVGGGYSGGVAEYKKTSASKKMCPKGHGVCNCDEYESDSDSMEGGAILGFQDHTVLIPKTKGNMSTEPLAVRQSFGTLGLDGENLARNSRDIVTENAIPAANARTGLASKNSRTIEGGNGFAAGTHMDTGVGMTLGAVGAGRSGGGRSGGAKKEMEGGFLPILGILGQLFGGSMSGLGKADKSFVTRMAKKRSSGKDLSEKERSRVETMGKENKLEGGFLQFLLPALAPMIAPIAGKLLGNVLGGVAPAGPEKIKKLTSKMAGDGLFSNLQQKMDANRRAPGAPPVKNPIEVLAKKAIASYVEHNKPKTAPPAPPATGAGASSAVRKSKKTGASPANAVDTLSSKGAGTSYFKTVESVKSTPKMEQTGPVPKAQMPSSTMSGGAPKGGRSKRAEIVKKVMKEKGLSMIAASKHVKEHNLY